MKKIKIFSAFLITLALPLLAKADVPIQDPLGLGTNAPIPKLANNLISVVLGLSGVLALIAFIYGGSLYLLSGVDANNVKKGKDIIKWAVAGLFLIFSSYAIVNFLLANVLGIK